MSSGIRDVDIHVILPVPPGAPESEDGMRTELRRLWLVEQVRHKRLGVGKAAELASMPTADFMQLLGAHGVPVIDYDPDDFEQELRDLGVE